MNCTLDRIEKKSENVFFSSYILVDVNTIEIEFIDKNLALIRKNVS